jgi:hypothetical protein
MRAALDVFADTNIPREPITFLTFGAVVGDRVVLQCAGDEGTRLDARTFEAERDAFLDSIRPFQAE